MQLIGASYNEWEGDPRLNLGARRGMEVILQRIQ